MTPANLPRVLIRLLGLFFLVQGLASAISAVVYVVMELADTVTYTGVSTMAYPASSFAWSAVALLLGLHLFQAGPKLVTAVTGGPLCPSCGYDLAAATGDRCPECGAAREPDRS